MKYINKYTQLDDHVAALGARLMITVVKQEIKKLSNIYP
jgi:hypothetical protein